jgi:predicted DNA-binding mobile mystery protein A
MKSSIRQLGMKQLDEKLRPIRKLPFRDVPMGGWIRSLRSALGIAGVDLARRLGIAPSSVSALENSEAAGTVSLNTLRKAAAAMDCDLVYAIVPHTSIAKVLERRAGEKADAMLRHVGQSMNLEAQGGVDEAARELHREILVESLLKKPSVLWK